MVPMASVWAGVPSCRCLAVMVKGTGSIPVNTIFFVRVFFVKVTFFLVYIATSITFTSSISFFLCFIHDLSNM